MKILENQLKMNNYILKTIVPSQVKNKFKNTETVDLSMTNITGNIDSVIKYFKVPYGDKKKSRLILKGCVLDDNLVYEIVG